MGGQSVARRRLPELRQALGEALGGTGNAGIAGNTCQRLPALAPLKRPKNHKSHAPR